MRTPISNTSMPRLQKPDTVFARDADWSALSDFATSPTPDLLLGVVSGRRRQGKTHLLQALTRACDGFYFASVPATEREALRQFAIALGTYLGTGEPRFDDWRQAARAMLDRCAGKVIVLDEFSYLADAWPALPSLLQNEIDARQAPWRDGARTRLLLCGSAMSFMGGLLAGTAPLRGRATLELVVQPFDYRTAAKFWSASDPRLAASLHAIVGGTPAYRTRFVDHTAPPSLEAFDDWIIERVLSPRSSLYREARYLLLNESGIRDEGLYHAVLGAIASGRTSRGGIANAIGKQSSDLAHPLSVLEDCRLIRKDADPFRKGRSLYRIAEPLITFYEAIMRPSWTQLELDEAAAVWHNRWPAFQARVLGPHFEELARAFTLRAGHLLGETPGQVAA